MAEQNDATFRADPSRFCAGCLAAEAVSSLRLQHRVQCVRPPGSPTAGRRIQQSISIRLLTESPRPSSQHFRVGGSGRGCREGAHGCLDHPRLLRCWFFLCSPSGKGHSGGSSASTRSPVGLLMSTRSCNDPRLSRVALSCNFGCIHWFCDRHNAVRSTSQTYGVLASSGDVVRRHLHPPPADSRLLAFAAAFQMPLLWALL